MREEHSNQSFRLRAPQRIRQKAAVDVACGRVAVILGANGSGKTQLLSACADGFLSDSRKDQLVRVESNRVLGNHLDNLDSSGQVRQHLSDPKSFELNYKSGERRQYFTNRIPKSLVLLKLKSEVQQREHYDRLEAWDDGGRIGPSPKKSDTPVQTAFKLFNAIFPRLTLEERNSAIRCTQDGDNYSPSSMSSGEQQCLALIFDLLLHADDKTTVLVDEPEAHLNPLLACRFWDVIEARLKNAQFVYATHCVSFAMRANVDSLFVLDANSDPQSIGSIHDLPRAEWAPFLGAIPSILVRSYAIAVEGEESSFDASFYPWILGRDDVAVVSLQSKNDVVAETDRLTLWQRLAPSARILGIVDRDYSDESPSTASQVITLQYHEAESYLCHPDIVSTVANAISGKELARTSAEAKLAIAKCAMEERFKVIARRIFKRLKVNVGISIPSSTLSRMTDDDKFDELLLRVADLRKVEISRDLEPNALQKLIRDERDAVDAAILDQKVDLLLKLLPGKELMRHMIQIAGVVDASLYLAACQKHVEIGQQSVLKRLRDEISDRLFA